jgi:formylglycine-generating enzyme required for sulfatase activity
MLLRVHLEIGVAALGRGYLEAHHLAAAVAELGAAAAGVPDTDFWLQRGLMTPAQLDDVLALVRRPSRLAFPATEPAETAASTPWVNGPTLFLGEVGGGATISDPPGPTAAARGGDRYTELAVLGEGGMGAVLECMDRDLGRRVAVKLVKPDNQDPTSARMLEREARVTGSLEHPNIVPVYDIGVTARGAPFYVMRLVEEPSLGEVITKLAAGDPAATAAYTTGRLLRHFIQICETADYAHSRGVIHCDLKPANVLLGSFGEVLVLDWGLAFRREEGTAYRGGTPGYMAPEQLDTARKRPLDARTDVYALGVILWEMLTLESYTEESRTTVIRGPVDSTPAPRDRRRPSGRVPAREIPAELDEICARALEADPDARFQSARDLAQAVAAFLEGTREKERRQQRADEAASEGDRLADGYFEFLETRPERVAELDAVRRAVAPWEPAERKRELWDEEDRLAITDAVGVRTLHAAIASYEQALEEVASHTRARRGLARLYRAQMVRAEERREELDRIYFEELVKQYDDGTVLASMRAEGRLVVTARPDAGVHLAAVEEIGRRLQPLPAVGLGPTPLEVPLPPGRHVATLEHAGAAPVRVPFLVRPGRTVRIEVDLESSRPGPDEVLIAGGPALLGGDGGSLVEVDVPELYLARYPVTFGEYLEFLTALVREDSLAAVTYAPRGRDGVLFWRWQGDEDTGRYVPARISTWSDDERELLRFPVFGVDAISAEAYAAWRSRRDGRTYRLPTEPEWEKAGRGADGRLYPWGDRFDASFCKMRQSRPGLPRPEPVGTFPIDESPYGVRDLAGGIAEWVVPSDAPRGGAPAARPMASRGGAWSDWSDDCLLGARRIYHAVERSSRVGFRLARSVDRG